MTDKQSGSAFSETGNSLDFSVLPLDNAATLLQKLGKSLLLDILQGILKDPAGLLSVQDLQILIRPGQFERLNILPISRVLNDKTVSIKQLIKKTWSGKLSFLEMFKQLSVQIMLLLKQTWSGFLKSQSRLLIDVFTRDLQFKGLLFQAMTGNMTSRDLGYRLWQRIDLYFGGISPNFLPDDFWHMVGQIAWQDIFFQKTAAYKIRNYFRDRVVFTLGDKAVTVLSPNTFWILIALARRTEPLHNNPQVNKELYIEAMKQVLAIVEHHVQQAEKWAGFWDQWVIWKALQCRPAGIKNFKSQLRTAIADLPIFEYMGSASLEQEKSGTEVEKNEHPLVMADPAWKKDIPDWFGMLMKLET